MKSVPAVLAPPHEVHAQLGIIAEVEAERTPDGLDHVRSEVPRLVGNLQVLVGCVLQVRRAAALNKVLARQVDRDVGDLLLGQVDIEAELDLAGDGAGDGAARVFEAACAWAMACGDVAGCGDMRGHRCREGRIFLLCQRSFRHAQRFVFGAGRLVTMRNRSSAGLTQSLHAHRLRRTKPTAVALCGRMPCHDSGAASLRETAPLWNGRRLWMLLLGRYARTNAKGCSLLM